MSNWLGSGKSALGVVATTVDLVGRSRSGGFGWDSGTPGYDKHWNVATNDSNEQTTHIGPGVQRLDGHSRFNTQLVNVRVGPDNVYIDTSNPPKYGSLAKVLGGAQRATGQTKPRVIPLSEVDISRPEPGRVLLQGGGVRINAWDDIPPGPPSQQSPLDQLRTTRKLILGR